MRYNVYHMPKENMLEKESASLRSFKLDIKDKFNAFSLLSALHNLHISWLSV